MNRLGEVIIKVLVIAMFGSFFALLAQMPFNGVSHTVIYCWQATLACAWVLIAILVAKIP